MRLLGWIRGLAKNKKVENYLNYLLFFEKNGKLTISPCCVPDYDRSLTNGLTNVANDLLQRLTFDLQIVNSENYIEIQFYIDDINFDNIDDVFMQIRKKETEKRYVSNTEFKNYIMKHVNDKKETEKADKTMRLLGWITSINPKRYYAIYRDNLTLKSIAFDKNANLIETHVVINEKSKSISFICDESALMFNQLAIDSKNIPEDILDFVNKNINCQCSKNEFLEKLELTEKKVDWNAMINFFNVNGITPNEVLRELGFC